MWLLSPLLGLPGPQAPSDQLRAPSGQGKNALSTTPGAAMMNRSSWQDGWSAPSWECLFPNFKGRLRAPRASRSLLPHGPPA